MFVYGHMYGYVYACGYVDVCNYVYSLCAFTVLGMLTAMFMFVVMHNDKFVCVFVAFVLSISIPICACIYSPFASTFVFTCLFTFISAVYSCLPVHSIVLHTTSPSHLTEAQHEPAKLANFRGPAQNSPTTGCSGS